MTKPDLTEGESRFHAGAPGEALGTSSTSDPSTAPMLEEAAELYAYNRWANRRILDACTALGEEQLRRDMGSSFPSVLATLQHILSAEWIWLERWNGRSPVSVPEDWRLSELAELDRRWSEVMAAQQAFLDTLAARDVRRTIDYRNTRGVSFSAPLSQLLSHVVNHSSYHRGQIVTLLRQLGASAPSTDLVLYHRERAVPSGRAPTSA